MVSGGAPGPRPAEAPSFINIRLADELAASGRTSEHGAGSRACGLRLRLRLVTSQGAGLIYWVFSEYLRAAPSNLHLALHAARGHHKEQLPQRDLPPIPPSSHPFAPWPSPRFAGFGTSVPV